MIACTEAPTQPLAVTHDPSTSAAAARNGLADALTRLAPSLDALEHDSTLQEALRLANAAIEQGHVQDLKHALDRADRIVSRMAVRDHQGGAADLDAVRLSLAEARQVEASMSHVSPTPDQP